MTHNDVLKKKFIETHKIIWTIFELLIGISLHNLETVDFLGKCEILSQISQKNLLESFLFPENDP